MPARRTLAGENKSSTSELAKTRAWKTSAFWLIFLLSIIWGLAFVAIRRADYELSPVNLALVRWFISAAAYGLLLLFLGHPKTRLERKDVPRLLVVSFANVPLYHIALNYGETTVSSGLAGLLISLGPVFIAGLSSYMLKEKITRNISLALGIALLGAVVLSVGNLSTSGLAGPAAVILSAVAYAIFSVLSKPLVKKYGALPVAMWAGLMGTAMLVPLISTSLVQQVESLSLLGWVSVLYLSLLSTVLGYSIFYTLVSRGAVSKLSIQLYLIPIVSVIGGVVILGESLSISTVIGGVMMLVAIALATRTKSQTTVPSATGTT